MQYPPTPLLRPALWALAITLLFLAGQAGAASSIVVTSANGVANANGDQVGTLDSIEVGQELEAEGQATLSLLMAESAVVQMCTGAALSFQRDTAYGPQVIDLSRGGMKANVGPRPEDQPLEIHTPAAIATLLGTAVHLYVDPETGDTTVTSIEHHVRVESHDPTVEGSVIIAPGQQTVVKMGKKPGRVHRIDPLAFSRSSDCLDDEDFRRAALLAQMQKHLDDVTQPIILGDVPTGPLDSAVSSGASSNIPTMSGIDPNSVGCLPGTGCVNGGANGTIPIIINPIPPTGPPGGIGGGMGDPNVTVNPIGPTGPPGS